MKKIELVCLSITVIVILGAMYFSARWVLADVYGERVAQSIEQWTRSKDKPSLTMLNQHLRFSEKSLTWSPHSPRYKELHARLRMLRLPYLDKETELVAELNLILQMHQGAVRERPHWPFSWANIVYIKGTLREFDSGYDQALRSVLDYGPYEADALQRVVFVAIRGWKSMSDKSQENFLQLVANSAEIGGQLVKSIRERIDKQGIADEICNKTPFHTPEGKEATCS